MPTILLNRKRYRVRGAITRERRSSVETDPGRQRFATWRIDTPGFLSVEDISRGDGFLGVCCVPADTVVTLPESVLAMSRRWYSGELVEITTARGHQLSATPNHPILTDRGWVEAGLLNEGDRVLSRIGCERAGLTAPDDEHVQAPIGDFFSAFEELLTAPRRAVLGMDLDGDRRDVEVDVVDVDRVLLNRVRAAFAQPAHEQVLTSASVGAPVLAGSGDASSLSASGRLASLGVVRRSDQGHAFLGGHLGVSEQSRLAGSATHDCALAEDALDRAKADAIRAPESNHAFAGEVALDDLVLVERREFEGHVFNFHSSEHWYDANSIITHNCNINTDSRWAGGVSLGPAVNSVDLSGEDNPHNVTKLDDDAGTSVGHLLDGNLFLDGAVTVEDVQDITIIHATGTALAYVARGYQPAKVDLSGTPARKKFGTVFTHPVTSVVTTYAADATVVAEVSFGLGDQQPYQVVQFADIGAGDAGDVVAPNTANQPARTFGIAPDRVVGMDQNVVRGNILTGAVSMLSPNWNTISTLEGRGAALRMTGFGVGDGGLWVISTSDGPYVLNQQTGEFDPLIPEIDNRDDNGRRTTEVSLLGVVVPTAEGVFRIQGRTVETWGPERFPYNTSPVQGKVLAVAASVRWVYTAIVDDNDDNGYIVAWRPRKAGDPHFDQPLVPYPIVKLDSEQIRALRYVGTLNGVRTSPTLIGGRDDDLLWITVGQTIREIDDSNYRYWTTDAGQLNLTQLRRDPHMLKDLEWVQFDLLDCEDGVTVRPYVSVDTDEVGANHTFRPLDNAIQENGRHRVAFGDGDQPWPWALGVRMFKLRFELSSDDATKSPRMLDEVMVAYRERPEVIREYTIPLDLGQGEDTSVKDRIDTLLDELGAEPVRYEDPDRDESFYVRVEGAAAEGSVAQLRVVEWVQ